MDTNVEKKPVPDVKCLKKKKMPKNEAIVATNCLVTKSSNKKLSDENCVLDKRKRRQFSLEEKLSILRELDSGKKQVCVARQFSLSNSTLSDIIKNRDKIMKLMGQSEYFNSRKKMRLGNFKELEAALIVWLKDLKTKSISINNCIVQTKAMEIAKLLDIHGFEASNGWLCRFKMRNGLDWKNADGFNAKLVEEFQLSNEEIISISQEKDVESQNTKPKSVKEKRKEKTTNSDYVISKREALLCVQTLKNYLFQINNVPVDVLMGLDEVDDYVSSQLL